MQPTDKSSWANYKACFQTKRQWLFPWGRQLAESQYSVSSEKAIQLISALSFPPPPFPFRHRFIHIQGTADLVAGCLSCENPLYGSWAFEWLCTVSQRRDCVRLPTGQTIVNYQSEPCFSYFHQHTTLQTRRGGRHGVYGVQNEHCSGVSNGIRLMLPMSEQEPVLGRFSSLAFIELNAATWKQQWQHRSGLIGLFHECIQRVRDGARQRER